MATMDTPPDGYPVEIIGYVEPWIASPGSTINIKVRKLVNTVLRLSAYGDTLCNVLVDLGVCG